MNGLKKIVLLGAAVTPFLALAVKGAPITEVAELTITVNTAAQTWQAFETNGNPSNTSGLDGIQFNVTGGGGVTVATSKIQLPQGSDAESGNNNGFYVQRQNFFGTPGALITAYQNTTSYSNNDLGSVPSIYLGVGNGTVTVPVSDDGAGTVTTKTIATPVLIGSGTYTGTNGSLTVNAVATAVGFLPVPMPAPTQNGVTVLPFTASSVVPETVQIGVPEPASLGLLAVAAGGLLLRRRR